MTFHGDGTKIPVPSYNIAGSRQLVEEAPPIEGGHTSSFHQRSQYEAANRILNTSDAALMSQIVDGFVATPAERRKLPYNSSLFDGLNGPPLHAVLNRPNAHGYSNFVPPQHGLNCDPSMVESFFAPAAHNFSASLSPSFGHIANARVPSNYSVSPGNHPESRPVQAVAPLPRNHSLSETPVVTESPNHISSGCQPGYLSSSSSTHPPQVELNSVVGLKKRRNSRKEGKDRGRSGSLKAKLSKIKSAISGDKLSISQGDVVHARGINTIDVSQYENISKYGHLQNTSSNAQSYSKSSLLPQFQTAQEQGAYHNHAVRTQLQGSHNLSILSSNKEFPVKQVNSSNPNHANVSPQTQNADLQSFLSRQNLMSRQFLTPVDKQRHLLTSQTMASISHSPQVNMLNQNPSVSNQTTSRSWGARQQNDERIKCKRSEKVSNFRSKSSPYNEAMLAQQRAQAQLYQSLNQPLKPPGEKTKPQEQQTMQQQAVSVQQTQQELQCGYQEQLPIQSKHLSGELSQPQQQCYQGIVPQQSTKVDVNSSLPQQTDDPGQKSFSQTLDQFLPTSSPHHGRFLESGSEQLASPQTPFEQERYNHHSKAKTSNAANYMNTPMATYQSTHRIKTKNKGVKSTVELVRVKFLSDGEEADIYKLKDITYPDDTEVSDFAELKPGMNVIARWPMNEKLYAALVIDPLDTTGRRIRERRPPRPFQAQLSSSRKEKKQLTDRPNPVLNEITGGNMAHEANLTELNDGFSAYISMADKIKLKKRERLAKEAELVQAKTRKRKRGGSVGSSSSGNLINVDSDESDAELVSPSRKRTRESDLRKKERRRTVESRWLHGDGNASFQRFNSLAGAVFDDIDSVDPKLIDEFINGGKDFQIPQCLLISKSRLQELHGETAKLKASGTLNQLPKKVLVRLLTVLEPSIRSGVSVKPMTPKGNTAEEQTWHRACEMDRVCSAAEAALVVMHVMTARFMPKTVYIDDVIERTAELLRQQLNNTIYPEYDLVYRLPSQTNKKKGTKESTNLASSRMKRAHYKGPKNRTILQFYNKLNLLLNLMVELVHVQPLTDTSILKISSLGISPFFVENVGELQLSAIRLITTIFARYDKHRSLILEDIFQSLARLPTSKRNLRSYRLNYAEELVESSDEEDSSGRRNRPPESGSDGELQHIQMVSALMLQMIQSIVQLPVPEPPDDPIAEKDKKVQSEVDEMKVITSYDMAVRTGRNFLSVFLKKCSSRSEDVNYKPLFENLVHDLLATVNKPEWPGSEMLLSVLGRLLVHTFSTKSNEMSLRVASLDYLGVVAAKLRRDAVSSQSDIGSVQALLKRLEEASNGSEERPCQSHKEDQQEDEENVGKKEEKNVKEKAPKRRKRKCFSKKRPRATKVKKLKDVDDTEEDKLTCRLQYLLLGYLRRNADAEPAFLFAHNFYIGQWLRDVSQQFQQLQQHFDRGGDAGDQMDVHSKDLQACQKKKDKLMELAFSSAVAASGLTINHVEGGEAKQPLKLSELQRNADKLAVGLTAEDAALISRHLASTRPFSRAFDSYLSYILRLRDEPVVALRTRAIKCLAEVVAVDPCVMEREDIAQGVQFSLVDQSTSVREAAIDLVGRFILLKPNLVKHYYDMLTMRILDTGVSVRKRVIRILRDLCYEYPDLPQLTDACVKMIRRVNDEEGIKKLVHEVFMKMWFTPVDPQDTKSLKKKALLITDTVAANRERGYEWIEQLFKNLIGTSTGSPQVEEACRQIVDCLVEHVIIFENPQKQNEMCAEEDGTLNDNDNGAVECQDGQESAASKANDRSIRLVATMQTLVQLARIRPRLLVPHVTTLQPYLATRCETSDDVLTVHGVCRTLELAIPLMEHPSETFLASIEEDMMRITLTQRFHIVSAAVACLGAVTCQVTQNYRLIWDCFQRLCTGLSNARTQHQSDPESIFDLKYYKQLLRTLFIIGHFAKNFDFDDEKIKGKTQVCVKDKVYGCLLYFSNLTDTPVTEELRGYSIAALGLLMVQDPNMMFRSTTRELYKTLLDADQKSDCLKKQVLQNLQSYLQTEDVKMQEAAEANVKKAKHEEDVTHLDNSKRSTSDDAAADDDIKEICDVSSGMASSVMQLFLKQVLEALFHRHVNVRHAALHTVYLTLQQGLVHPVQCVPYLIAAASDPEPTVHKEADQQLIELNKRYHGFVNTKALQGMRLAYHLQSYVQPDGQIIRGYMDPSVGGLDDGSGNTPKASCAQLYQLVRSDRKHRRALLLSLLHMFDDTVKVDLEMLVFVADNLAYFPYHTQDEPLFLINQIEVYVSVSGSNVLQSFKESLQSKKLKRPKMKRKQEKSEETNGAEDVGLSSSSDDDSDDEETIETRLPLLNEPIEEFAQSSLACLLLLWLKQHLKTLFGFTDKKIQKYSPSEVNRALDKQCHRRRHDLRFNPEPALHHITRQHKQISCRDPEYIRAVVNQYAEFNKLMNQLDPDEDDSDQEQTTSSKNNVVPADAKKNEGTEEIEGDTDEEPKQAATLDTIRRSTALKSKKASKHQDRRQRSGKQPPSERKKPRVQYRESSSESDDEFCKY